MLLKVKIDAQLALDDLSRENLIQFKLVAQKATHERAGEVRVHFYDSRLHSIVVDLDSKTSIREQVRRVVQQRLNARDPLSAASDLHRRSA